MTAAPWFVPPLQAGDVVHVSAHQQTRVRATVTLASDNGRALILEFPGGFFGCAGGAYVGAMAVLQEDDGRWIELLNRTSITMERP